METSGQRGYSFNCSNKIWQYMYIYIYIFLCFHVSPNFPQLLTGYCQSVFHGRILYYTTFRILYVADRWHMTCDTRYVKGDAWNVSSSSFTLTELAPRPIQFISCDVCGLCCVSWVPSVGDRNQECFLVEKRIAKIAKPRITPFWKVLTLFWVLNFVGVFEFFFGEPAYCA